MTVDSLLKDTPDEPASGEKGYYVSKEMAEGYLTNQRAWLRKAVFGIGVLILSATAFLKFEYEGLTPLVLVGMILLGGFCALRGALSSDRQYQVLKQEPLIFDSRYLSELRLASERLSRRLTPLFVASFVGMMLSVLSLSVDMAPLQKDFALGVPLHIEVAVAALALTASLLFYSGTMLESYQLLAKNEEHVNGFWFRLWRKTRRKADDLLK